MSTFVKRTRTNIVILCLVGLLDLVTTVFWLTTGQCIEVNPVMVGVLNVGMPFFILVKLSTLAAYAVAMEWYVRRQPERARMFSALTLILYLTVYGISFTFVNYSNFLG